MAHGYDGGGGHSCFYLEHLAAAPFGSGITDPRLTQLDGEGIDGVLSELAGGPQLGVGEDIAAALDVFRVQAGIDPLALANELRNTGGGPLSPIHAVAPAVHWSFAPGEPAGSVPFDALDHVAGGNPVADVAVVDTGIVPDTGFAWLDPHMRFDPVDVDAQLADEPVRGHGTFVASLIRQVAPTARVSMARARIAGPAAFSVDGPDPPPPFGVSDELHVLEAVVRLIKRHREDPPVALNMSVGTYACDVGDSPIPALAAALAMWAEEMPGAPIVAAGGNEDLAAPFWPAADTQLTHGVDAIDTKGDRTVWTETGAKVTLPTNATDHAWAERGAPGISVIGVRGPKEIASWSGSSFAAALWTACVAAGGCQADAAAIPITTYDKVPRLVYRDGTGMIQKNP